MREERSPILLTITGSIPSYAAGTLYRNGPGARELQDETGETRYSVSHWFDGLAQLHKFDLIPGADGIASVQYTSRFGQDVLMQQLVQTGHYTGFTFGQKRDPCMSLFRKVMCLFTPVPALTAETENVAVTITANASGFPVSSLGHKADPKRVLIARTDNSTLKALDAETLEPVGIADQADLHPLLKGPLSASHAKSDPITGDVFNYNLDLGRLATYRVFKTSAETGETEILATISGDDIAPAYMHSFFLSENFVILAVWSAHLEAGGLRVLWEKNVLDAIAPFDETKKVHWFVVDRRHGRGLVGHFHSPAAFCFHTINAYETPSAPDSTAVDIVCDLIQYDNLDLLKHFYYEHLRSSSPQARAWSQFRGCFTSYRLPGISTKGTSAIASHALPQARLAVLNTAESSRMVGDMPTINPRVACKPYRYFWNSTIQREDSSFFDGLAKIDRINGTSNVWKNPFGHTPGEAIFIPRPGGTEEDDGVLLTVVLDAVNGTSYLLCLDAATMEEMGRADCHGPLPFMFHGQHVSSISGGKVVDM